MKTFAKVFIVSFVCFFLAILIGSYSYVKEKDIKLETNINNIVPEKININKYIVKKIEVKPKEIKSYPNLTEAIEGSNRINFLILGLEDVRTDTIIFASFCPDTKKVNLINIPRDTYIHRKGHNGAAERKINSIYADHGVTGVRKAVSYILGDLPIHHHIILDYAGVEKIVDEIGGIEVDVPFNMNYKDPTAKPPLNINIKSGNQILDGEKSLQFLRYRKGNNSKDGYIDGDLGRIRAQQQFLNSFIDKASENILTVITKGFGYVKTDINMIDSISYGRKAIGIKKEDFELGTLPGKAEFKKVNKKILSYFTYNSKEIKKRVEEIYNVKDPNND